jgi:hypothetical protein
MRRILLLLALLALLAACDRAAETELTTTTRGPGASTVAPPAADTTTTAPAPETTATTVAANPIETYDVQVSTTVDEGEVLWVTVPAEDYTDRDLENFLLTASDENEDLYEMHVLDSAEAVEAARTPEDERTPEQQALVDAHYLVSLTEGSQVTFHGPFASVEGFILGS